MPNKVESRFPLMVAKNVSFSYGSKCILDNVSLQIHPGEIVALLGENGAGKSTLLQLLLGLEKPYRGEIRIKGKQVSSYRRKELACHVAYVSQHHESPFPYKVKDVVAMGCFCHSGLLSPCSEEDHQLVMTLLENFEISHLAERPYTQISGGERQMVLMCRALAQGANILVLDEPASALDFGHQARLLAQLKRLTSQNVAVLMSTHHPQHAQAVADRAILLKNGSLVSEGNPKVTLTDEVIAELYGLSADELALVMPQLVIKESRYA